MDSTIINGTARTKKFPMLKAGSVISILFRVSSPDPKSKLKSKTIAAF